MPKATNHNKKKAARKMERWRQRRREIAMRRAVALGVEFMKERLTAPSWMDLVLRRGEAYAFTKPEFVGEMPKPRLLGVVENFSPTGRRTEAIHELPRRRYYIPGKTQTFGAFELSTDPTTRQAQKASMLPFLYGRSSAEPLLAESGDDYGPLEARADALCASVSQGRLSSGQPSQDLLPWVDYAGLEARVLVGVDMSRDGDRLAMNLVYRPSYIPVPMTIRLMPPEPEED